MIGIVKHWSHNASWRKPPHAVAAKGTGTMTRQAVRERLELRSRPDDSGCSPRDRSKLTSPLGMLQNDAIALQAVRKKALSRTPEVEIELPIILFAEVRDNSFPL